MSTMPIPSTAQQEPVWELATLWPLQGEWTEEDYFQLVQEGANRLIELTDGVLEFLPMPTDQHQDIMVFLFDALRAFVAAQALGKVRIAGLPVRVRSGKTRQPDIVFLAAANAEKRLNTHWEGADLAIEVVSDDPTSRQRDYGRKPLEYAAARIPEYWIVDPQESKITVLTLPDGADAYAEHGVFTPGQAATSQLLEGFSVDVRSAFDAAKQ